MPQGGPVFLLCEDCRKGFRSKTGFQKHQEKNEKMKNGLCRPRGKGSRSVGTPVVPVWYDLMLQNVD